MPVPHFEPDELDHPSDELWWAQLQLNVDSNEHHAMNIDSDEHHHAMNIESDELHHVSDVDSDVFYHVSNKIDHESDVNFDVDGC